MAKKHSRRKNHVTDRRQRAWELFAEGKSQQDIAHEIGITQSTVSRYLQGKNTSHAGADRAEARCAAQWKAFTAQEERNIDDDDGTEAGLGEHIEKTRREYTHDEVMAEVKDFAKLSELKWDLRRQSESNRLDVPLKALDREVKKARRALNGGDGQQGRAVKVADIKPWPESVDGCKLADALVAAIKRHAVLRNEHADTIAVWNVHTFLVNEFYISPRLAITSPTKGCGKTLVLRLLNVTSCRPKRSGSISPPALFRAVEMYQPTFLLDETEKYVEHGSDLHALLNEGHCKGASVMRVLGDNLELREFRIYGAAAYARNGSLPDDLEQRSIVIEMQRRTAAEVIEELRDDRCEHLIELARKCARWSKDNAARVKAHDPDIGDLVNRGGDNWRPLFAIADIIGGDWPIRIRSAAHLLAPREPNSNGVVLLGDIKVTFAADNTDRLSSSRIAGALHEIEGRPWAEWGRAGKPISPNQIARLLKEYKIVSGTIRVGEITAKGYYLHQFTDAFERYLGPHPPSEPSQRHNATATGTSSTFQNVTPESVVTVQKCEKPNNHVHCDVVTAQNPPLAADEHFPAVCQYCGGAETPKTPVLPVGFEGVEYLLHKKCRSEWLEQHYLETLDKKS